MTHEHEATLLPDFPSLLPGQCALQFAEVATGIILDVELSRWRRDTANPRFQVFSTLDEARTFARALVKKDAHVECWGLDERGVALERIDADGTHAIPITAAKA